ncbi:MAG TPA: DUF371 domain-containing protein [Candidatus Nitrosocosmicus sp.]|nr:DUF371 domain-containing protein [Candidatus Nitrosocosmicus sp.]
MITEEIKFFGHKNVLSLHPRTLEITKDLRLTSKGDCIIGVKATKACSDIRADLKQKIRTKNSRIEFELIVEPFTFSISGLGSCELSLDHSHDIVLRKSTFICSRTICLNSSTAAVDIPRQIIDLLKDPEKEGTLRIMVD